MSRTVYVDEGPPVVQRYNVSTIHGDMEDTIFPDWPWVGGDSIEDAAEAYEGSWFRRSVAPAQSITAVYTGDGAPPDPTKPPAQDWSASDHVSVRLRAAVLPVGGLRGHISSRTQFPSDLAWELDARAFVANQWQAWILAFSVVEAAAPGFDFSSVTEISFKFPGFGPDSFDLDDFRVGFTRRVPILGVGSSVRAR